MRVILGFMMAFLLGGAGWAVGAYVWVGVSVALAIAAALIGFVVGFFWMEIKQFLQMLGGFFT